MEREEPLFWSRWLRRGLIRTSGIALTLPYFRLLNKVTAEGDEILRTLPRKNVVFLSNHQTYIVEAVAFFDLVYIRHRLPLENPFLRFSAAAETMSSNALMSFLTIAGCVTFKRSFREAGVDINRPVDLEGVARVEKAIADGWLLHFPSGTTKAGAPLRQGVAQLLHRTKAVAVPVRVDGFRDLLLHKQIPGKLFKRCHLRLYPPLDLADFYANPYQKEAGRAVIQQLAERIGDREV